MEEDRVRFVLVGAVGHGQRGQAAPDCGHGHRGAAAHLAVTLRAGRRVGGVRIAEKVSTKLGIAVLNLNDANLLG